MIASVTVVVPRIGSVHPKKVRSLVLEVPHGVEGGRWRSEESGYIAIGVLVLIVRCLPVIGEIIWICERLVVIAVIVVAVIVVAVMLQGLN